MTLARGWKARQEAAQKRQAQLQHMYELNRARAEIVGHPITPETIVPIPAPTAPVVEAVEDDQFDPAVDTAPEPAPAPKGRRKA